MTNTTRTLTFRSGNGHTLLRVETPHDPPLPPGATRYALQIAVGNDAVWRMLTGDQVEELHELTGLILKGRDRIYPADGDDYLPCSATHDGETRAFVCCLEAGHVPAAGAPHVDRSGVQFA